MSTINEMLYGRRSSSMSDIANEYKGYRIVYSGDAYDIYVDLTGPEEEYGNNLWCGSANSMSEARSMINKFYSGKLLPAYETRMLREEEIDKIYLQDSV